MYTSNRGSLFEELKRMANKRMAKKAAKKAEMLNRYKQIGGADINES